MKVYGVFVSFYPHYAIDSFYRFENLLKRLIPSPEIIIACSTTSPLAKQENAIIYTNTHWEFSGWQEGIDRLTATHLLKDEDLIVFANDTFCRHRHFGWLDEIGFTLAFKSVANGFDQAIAGDLCTWKEVISLPGLRNNQWISTYLFAMRYQTLKLLNGLHYSECEINEIILELNDSQIRFCPQIDAQFSCYINGWLYPTEPGRGWPKSHGASSELKRGKIKAILNEKRLSLKLLNQGVRIEPVYIGPFNVYRLWRERALKLKRLIGDWLNTRTPAAKCAR